MAHQNITFTLTPRKLPDKVTGILLTKLPTSIDGSIILFGTYLTGVRDASRNRVAFHVDYYLFYPFICI
jgi:hypothetical protein